MRPSASVWLCVVNAFLTPFEKKREQGQFCLLLALFFGQVYSGISGPSQVVTSGRQCQVNVKLIKIIIILVEPLAKNVLN